MANSNDFLSPGGLKVTVGRMGGHTETVRLEEGATVEDALKAGGFELGERERVHLNSKKLESSELKKTEVSNGDFIAIAGAKEGGAIR